MAQAGDKAPSLLEFELRSLADPETHSLSRYAGKPVVLLLFQPDCNWCLRQARVAGELTQSCTAGFETVLIGFRGNRSQLRKELRRLDQSFPAYQASPELLDAVGNPQTTPVMLLGDEDGRFVSWIRGFLPADEFLEHLRAAGDIRCSDQPG